MRGSRLTWIGILTEPSQYRCPSCGRCFRVRAWPLSCTCQHFAFDASDSADVATCGQPLTFVASSPVVRELVGDCLKEVLAELGIDDKDGCGCASMAAKMNFWGVAGCEVNRKEILCHLRKSASERGWQVTCWAALLALRKAKWLNPLSPFGSLLDEAMRRASILDWRQAGT